MIKWFSQYRFCKAFWLQEKKHTQHIGFDKKAACWGEGKGMAWSELKACLERTGVFWAKRFKGNMVLGSKHASKMGMPSNLASTFNLRGKLGGGLGCLGVGLFGDWVDGRLGCWVVGLLGGWVVWGLYIINLLC